MHSRLDTFITALREALQPHGGCQCGCNLTVLGAVGAAIDALTEADEAAEQAERHASEAAYDRYGSGE